jgi:hypothetical protein
MKEISVYHMVILGFLIWGAPFFGHNFEVTCFIDWGMDRLCSSFDSPNFSLPQFSYIVSVDYLTIPQTNIMN